MKEDTLSFMNLKMSMPKHTFKKSYGYWGTSRDSVWILFHKKDYLLPWIFFFHIFSDLETLFYISTVLLISNIFFFYYFLDDNDNDKMLTIEQWQVDWILVEFSSRYNGRIKRYDINIHQEWCLSRHSLCCCVKNNRRPQSPDFEELCLGIFEVFIIL